jgi:hypothetical protein
MIRQLHALVDLHQGNSPQYLLDSRSDRRQEDSNFLPLLRIEPRLLGRPTMDVHKIIYSLVKDNDG